MTSTVPDSSHQQNQDPGGGAEHTRPLLEPSEGIPPVIVDEASLHAAAARLAAGNGPVAFDAERASGYRYSQRAYLVQIRRRGSGTHLIDPVALPDLVRIQQAVGDAEWVLHAASQDLPCLAELGLRPGALFDTELAGRLLGYERVGLGIMVEKVLGFSLEKGHSAADWSTRPLPEPWLRYAALDVELLIELRDALHGELAAQDKLRFAREEFAAIAAAPPREPRPELWRRTSGIHRVRNRRQLAAVRSMWTTRDRIARERDIAPGRVLPDSAIIDAVLNNPADVEALTRLPIFSGPRLRRNARTWLTALREAASLPEDTLPPAVAPGGDGLPPPNRWADRDPVAAARLVRVRAQLGAIAAERSMPVENLLEPALARRLAWSPPAAPASVEIVAELLRKGGARPWQVELTASPIASCLSAPPAPPERLDEPAPRRDPAASADGGTG
ncbi:MULTISPECIES: HRDC domain-containing protein [unclassified Frankia]|uniref:HRDC domain-containing protein n=1 Tax=unclassified Frankia TaxID=2632575 RepID=UPI001EF61CF8|nr:MULTISPECIES: HRDC domain-containing protein [unclassified Frankia]